MSACFQKRLYANLRNYGIGWIVAGTMTGAQSRKVHTEPAWAFSLTEQAHRLNIPVFWKEDLVPIMGEEQMIQELPAELLCEPGTGQKF